MWSQYIYTRDYSRNLTIERAISTSCFWSLAVCKNRGGRPGRFSHMHDVRVDVRGGQCPIVVTHKLGVDHCLPNNELYWHSLSNITVSSSWTWYYKKDLKILHRAPSPPPLLMSTWRHTRDSFSQASIFAYCQKLEVETGNETSIWKFLKLLCPLPPLYSNNGFRLPLYGVLLVSACSGLYPDSIIVHV